LSINIWSAGNTDIDVPEVYACYVYL